MNIERSVKKTDNRLMLMIALVEDFRDDHATSKKRESKRDLKYSRLK